RVAGVVAKLKERGFISPYLRAFVVARVNPLRWIQGDPPPLEEVLKTMRERAAKFNTEKIKQEDLASAGGAPDDAEGEDPSQRAANARGKLMATRPVVRIAPNNPVSDLPVIVGIEEGLFAKAGLEVSFSATYADRERDNAEKPVLSRLKESMFECGSADSYNVCEWASIDRLERGKRGGSIAALRAAVAAQAILTFDDKLQTPRDLADVPVVVQELTGSHYTALQMLESAVGKEHVNIQNGGRAPAPAAGLANGTQRAPPPNAALPHPPPHH